MEKIIELANRLDEAGRFDEADFVTRRVVAAAALAARRKADTQQRFSSEEEKDSPHNSPIKP